MKNTFWNFAKNEASPTKPESAILRIQGDIVDDDDAWIYEWMGTQSASPNTFRTELAQYAGMPIDVWIDSNGGSVFAAAGIYNALMEHKGGVTVKIDGKAMSAASVIAMAGTTVQMSPVATMMIHDPLISAQGYASDLRKAADVLDTIKESIMNAYQLKTNKSRAEISQMMDDVTYMDAATAVKNGFADSIMYADKFPKDDAKNFAFNYKSIVNSANSSIKRFLALEKLQNKPQNEPDLEKAKAILALQCEL